MIIKIDRSFEKDTDKIKDKKILNLIAECIENVQNAKRVNEISQIKKLQGYNSHYRIKIKDYRIGISIENNVIEFIRFLHRKEIYRYFPQ